MKAFALVCGAAILTVAAAPKSDVVDVRDNMVDGVNPAALAMWEVSNGAIDENGGLDPSRMNAEAWAKIADAAQSLGIYAHRLAAAKVIRASSLGGAEGKPPEGMASSEQIQAMIDANPAGFRASAAAMEQQAKALAAAAAKRDLKTTGDLVSNFDQTCRGCHENYWYLKP